MLPALPVLLTGSVGLERAAERDALTPAASEPLGERIWLARATVAHRIRRQPASEDRMERDATLLARVRNASTKSGLPGVPFDLKCHAGR